MSESTKVQRYDYDEPTHNPSLLDEQGNPAPAGEYVKASDHEAAVKGLREALEAHEALMELACADIIFFHSQESQFTKLEPYEHPAKVEFSVLVNDLFYPAADAHGFDISQAVELREIFRKDGEEGVIRWVQRQRGNMPLRPRAEERIRAKEQARCRLK